MKKLISLATIALMAVGVTFAQATQNEQNQTGRIGRSERVDRSERRQRTQQPREEQRQRETVTIDGSLKLERGFVAVESGERTIIIPMLNRYIGFINGLQEGSNVSVEGFAHRNLMHPQKVTIGGREYDFSGAQRMYAQRNVPSQQNRYNAPNRNYKRQGFYGSCCPRQQRFDRNNAPRRVERGEDRNRRDRPQRSSSAGNRGIVTD